MPTTPSSYAAGATSQPGFLDRFYNFARGPQGQVMDKMLGTDPNQMSSLQKVLKGIQALDLQVQTPEFGFRTGNGRQQEMQDALLQMLANGGFEAPSGVVSGVDSAITPTPKTNVPGQDDIYMRRSRSPAWGNFFGAAMV